MAGPPIRVLLVEDDEDDYVLTRHLFSAIADHPYQLEWISSFEEAIPAIAARRHDVYLLDYRLGAHSGLELLAEWSAHGRPGPVILLTGQGEREIDMEALKAGAADYLVKGTIDATLLDRAIRYALERHRHHDLMCQAREQLERRVQERTVELEEMNRKLSAENGERRRAEEALRDADRRKDEFLAMLAHELRNPLAPIRSAVEILSLCGSKPSEVAWARDVIDRQVQHMARLVDDLLDVSRITRGKITIRKEPVELCTVITRAVEAARPWVDARRHELSVSFPREPVPIVADPARLAQVFSNLLNNAAKYTEDHGRIWLSVERHDGQVAVKVKDTGIGIAPDLLPHVFDLFRQADHSLARSQGGLGIGLTLVKNLVEMHDGRVEASSAGPGHGSEFIVSLPSLSPSAKKEPMGGRLNLDSRIASRRIVVVDDNIDAAESLSKLLQLKGHHVRVAHDGHAVVDLALDFRPEIVLLDIGLPGISGYEVARRLRQQAEMEALLLVAVTGYGQDSDRRRSKNAGFDYHLVKPITPEALEHLLTDPEVIQRAAAPGQPNL